jgi:hypothetical protein
VCLSLSLSLSFSLSLSGCRADLGGYVEHFKGEQGALLRDKWAAELNSTRPQLRAAVEAKAGVGFGLELAKAAAKVAEAEEAAKQGDASGIDGVAQEALWEKIDILTNQHSLLEKQHTKDQRGRREATAVLSRMVVDGKPGLKPLEPSTSGVLFHIDVFGGFIKFCNALLDDDPAVLFKAARPSSRLADYLPAAAVARLREWEDKVYTYAGRDSKGVKVVDSLREWMDKTRETPPEPKWSTVEANIHQRLLIIETVKAMVVEWEKVMAKGFVGELRAECRTAWMKEVLDKCTHHTMLCEANLGVMKYVTKRMATASIAARKGKVNARMSRTWEVYDRMSQEEKDVALWLSRRLLSYMDEYDQESQEMHDEQAALRRFSDIEEKVKKAAK